MQVCRAAVDRKEMLCRKYWNFTVTGLEPACHFDQDRYCGDDSVLFLWYFCRACGDEAASRARAVIDGFLTLPMILPPTVAGFFLLLIFSLRRPFGAALYENFGIKAVQTWLGCILAATIIAFPLMYRNTRAAFEQVDTNLIYAARTLGMSEWKIFWKVVIPSAGPGVLSGTVLAFARALGEYGATSMLAGNIPERRVPFPRKSQW